MKRHYPITYRRRCALASSMLERCGPPPVSRAVLLFVQLALVAVIAAALGALAALAF